MGASVPMAANTRINADNPKGHWEHREVNFLNDQMLRQFGMTWAAPGPVDLAKVAPIHVDRLQKFLAREVAAAPTDPIVFKDPRICLLLPVWLSALKRLGWVPKIILPVRHPQAVAKSLHKRNRFSIERGLFLWLHYNVQALRSISGHRVMRLVFPDWLSVSSELYSRSAEALDIDWSVDAEQARNSAAALLDRELVHEVFYSEPVTLLEKASCDLFAMLRDSAQGNDSIPGSAGIEHFVEDNLGWLETVSTVLLDERQIWREKIDSMHHMINRNS